MISPNNLTFFSGVRRGGWWLCLVAVTDSVSKLTSGQRESLSKSSQTRDASALWGGSEDGRGEEYKEMGVWREW